MKFPSPCGEMGMKNSWNCIAGTEWEDRVSVPLRGNGYEKLVQFLLV